jgi:hypothetical protein
VARRFNGGWELGQTVSATGTIIDNNTAPTVTGVNSIGVTSKELRDFELSNPVQKM